jgi:UDP-2,3-diacylglucosamine hydrolase
MSTWFISDLHLFPNRPQSIQLLQAFVEYLGHAPDDVEGLYILGDLLEFWVGDDLLEHPIGESFKPLLQLLSTLAAKGVPIAFQHGNRDFLLGAHFAKLSGMTLLPEKWVIDLYGTPTLLLHGDSLCTDDVTYQQLRTQLRNPEWQTQFLALPLEQRVAQAQALREESKTQTQAKEEAILDVNPETVIQMMQRTGVTQLIHGHTHRPAIHKVCIQERAGQRIVLGDWYGSEGSFLKVDAKGVQLLKHYLSL